MFTFNRHTPPIVSLSALKRPQVRCEDTECTLPRGHGGLHSYERVGTRLEGGPRRQRRPAQPSAYERNFVQVLIWRTRVATGLPLLLIVSTWTLSLFLIHNTLTFDPGVISSSWNCTLAGTARFFSLPFAPHTGQYMMYRGPFLLSARWPSRQWRQWPAALSAAKTRLIRRSSAAPALTATSCCTSPAMRTGV